MLGKKRTYDATLENNEEIGKNFLHTKKNFLKEIPFKDEFKIPRKESPTNNTTPTLSPDHSTDLTRGHEISFINSNIGITPHSNQSFSGIKQLSYFDVTTFFILYRNFF